MRASSSTTGRKRKRRSTNSCSTNNNDILPPPLPCAAVSEGATTSNHHWQNKFVCQQIDDLLLQTLGGFETTTKSDSGNNSNSTNSNTQTKAGWCLRQGLYHIASVDNQSLLPRILHHGVPPFYFQKKKGNACRHEATQDLKDPQTCFQSLCRIIAGQFVSGKSAQAAWNRLLSLAVDNDKNNNTDAVNKENDNKNNCHGGLTPEFILLHYKDNNVDQLQAAAGLTKAKARSIVDLAHHFVQDEFVLSEDWLQDPCTTEDELRQALLQVKGIGVWSCDMFLLFYLERPNVLPLGDLGVRKGLARHFFSPPPLVSGSATTTTTAASQRKKSPPPTTRTTLLCPKKDAARILTRLQPFAPYYSLLSYYMWRVADTPDMNISAAALLPSLAVEDPHTTTGSGSTKSSGGDDTSRRRVETLPKENGTKRSSSSAAAVASETTTAAVASPPTTTTVEEEEEEIDDYNHHHNKTKGASSCDATNSLCLPSLHNSSTLPRRKSPRRKRQEQQPEARTVTP
ncbi:hypothetical protein ACA910_016219 [Epithemia clementina (nom. ined.)]